MRLLVPALLLAALRWPALALEENTKELPSTLSYAVTWEGYQKSKGARLLETGRLTLHLSGKLVQSTAGGGVMAYGFQETSASYEYLNVGTDKDTGKELSRETGSGSVRVGAPETVTDPTTMGHGMLQVYTGDVAKVFALQMAKDLTPAAMMKLAEMPARDSYVFALSVPCKTTLTMRGRSQPHMYLATMNLQMIPLPKGPLTGSDAWTSNSRENVMIAPAMDLPRRLPGKVSYRVSWAFGEVPPAVEIHFRNDEGQWTDVTDAAQDVLVGRKVRLKAVFQPAGSRGEGTWEVPGKVIADWKATEQKAEVAPFDAHQEQETAFAWVGSGVRKVRFQGKVGGQEAEAATTFQVVKPQADVQVLIGEPEVAGIRESPGAKPRWELLLMRSSKPEVGIQLSSKVTASGGGTVPAKMLQYVQLVKTEAYGLIRLGYPNMEWHQDVDTAHVLDGAYPYPSKPDGDRLVTFDIPGNPLTNMAACFVRMDFRTYLMFRPSETDSPDAVWVPLKVVKWHWGGAARHATPGPFDPVPPPPGEAYRLIRKEPPGPTRAVDVSDHPTWTECRGDDAFTWRLLNPRKLVTKVEDWTPDSWERGGSR